MSTDAGWGDYLAADTPAADAGAAGTADAGAAGTADAGAAGTADAGAAGTADAGAAGTGDAGAAAGSVEPVAEPVGLPEPAASIVEAEVAGAAADQDWADWHADTGTDWQNSANDYLDYAQQNAEAGNADIAASALNTAAAHADIAQGHYETAGDYEIDVADHIATAAGEAIVYDTDPGSGL